MEDPDASKKRLKKPEEKSVARKTAPCNTPKKYRKIEHRKNVAMVEERTS